MLLLLLKAIAVVDAHSTLFSQRHLRNLRNLRMAFEVPKEN
jgi:hypothetical protein